MTVTAIALPVLPTGIPAEIKAISQWLTWRYEFVDDDPEPTKVPYVASGSRRASSTNPATWAPYRVALNGYERGDRDGVGFVLTSDVGIIGWDFDDCRDPDTGKIDPTVLGYVADLDSYTEITPSGTGLRVLLYGDIPKSGKGAHVEVYADLRYLTVTGQHLEGTPTTINERAKACARLYAHLFPKRPEPAASARSEPSQPSNLDDRAVLDLASNARNGGKFDRLWNGDTSLHGGDDSAADLALVSILAFYTQDEAQLDRLFRHSGLYRAKWDDRHSGDGLTYGQMTIARALSGGGERYSPGRSASTPTGERAAGSDTDNDGGKAESAKQRGRKSQATQLVELVQESNTELWCTPDGDPYISITIKDRIEHHQLGSKACADLFGKVFYDVHRAVPGAQAIKDAVHALGGIARYEGDRHPVFTRIGHHDGAIWVDLGGDDYSAVEISPSGWRVVPSLEIPIKFRRSQSMKALPPPARGASLEDLRELFNIEGDEWTLITAWLIGCFQPQGARAFLELNGQQGSGKTTCLRFLINLVDPTHVDVRSLPKDEDALIIAIRARAVLGFDNLSSVSPDMADALCRVSTGGGLGKRMLYSDAEEALYRVQLPLAWTGINSVAAGYGDLQDRTLSVTIGSLDGDARKSELKLWTRFTELHASLLGALYDVVSTALRRLPDIEQLDEAPRLADFAAWVESAAPALGWDDGEFLAALEASRARASQLTVDSSPIGDIIIAMVREQDRWEMTGTELLEELRTRADDERKRQRRFPKQPNHLTGHLRRIRPALGDIGIWVGFEHGRDKRVITLERNPSKFIMEAAPTQEAEETHFHDEPAPSPQPEQTRFERAHVPGTCVEPDCGEPIEPPSNYYCRMHARGVA